MGGARQKHGAAVILRAIAWWCETIGITDPQAVQTAAGVVAGMSFILVLYLALGAAMSLVVQLVSGPRK